MNTTREVITQVLQDHMAHSVVIRTEQLVDALVSALQQRELEVLKHERERAARIIKEHREKDICRENCWTAITNEILDTSQEGEQPK